MAAAYHADDAIAVSSGMAAIACALQAVVSEGDHILVADTVYRPTRNYCDNYLARMGVETTYYDPTIGAGVAELITGPPRSMSKAGFAHLRNYGHPRRGQCRQRTQYPGNDG